MPETKLLALLVVAVKLFHPFDSLNRQLKSPFELGVFSMDWDVWNESRSKYAKKASSPHKLERGKEMLVNAQDVMQMSGEQLDEYLDWCEKTWVDENHEPKKRGVPEQLLEMFPTGRADGSSPVKVDFNEENRAKEEFIEENLRTIQKSLQVRDLISEKREQKSNVAIRRLGSFYKRYRTLGQLLPPAKLFYEAAATLGCISLHSLLISVLQIENKLQLWRAKQLKDEKRRSEAEKLNGESGESNEAASSGSKTGEEGIVDSSDDFSDSSAGGDHDDLEMLNAENNT